MPIIEFMSNSKAPPRGFLRHLCSDVALALGLPKDNVWAIWHEVKVKSCRVPHWGLKNNCAPIITVRCRSTYSKMQIRGMIHLIASIVSKKLGVEYNKVFVSVSRVMPDHLLVRGKIWQNKNRK